MPKIMRMPKAGDHTEENTDFFDTHHRVFIVTQIYTVPQKHKKILAALPLPRLLVL